MVLDANFVPRLMALVLATSELHKSVFESSTED